MKRITIADFADSEAVARALGVNLNAIAYNLNLTPARAGRLRRWAC